MLYKFKFEIHQLTAKMSELLNQLCMTFDTMGTGNNDVRKQAEDYLKHVSSGAL